MKFDDLLAQYLYEYKTLHLQEIGSFELDKAVVVPQQTEKDVAHPLEGLHFTYNTKATTTDDLVNYLVKKLRKIKPLVSSDLDSYLSNIRQFINIGKPYDIEGIGTLQSNNHNEYEFIPGNFLHLSQYSREEHTAIRERPPVQVRHNSSVPKTGNSNKAVIAVFTILILAGIGWGFYTFVYKPSRLANGIAEPITTPNAVESAADTANVSRRPNVSSAQTNDSSDYKMIFEITASRQRARTRTSYLNKLQMPAKMDSITIAGTSYFRMFIPVTATSADTLRIRDSLYKIFAKKIIVQKSGDAR